MIQLCSMKQKRLRTAMEVWYRISVVFELLMTLLFVAALKTQTSCCYWWCSMIPSSFSLPIPFSRRIYPRFSSLEMSAIMQWVEWSQFAVDYFRIWLIWYKSTKIQLIEITPKHCSEAVCTLLLRVAGTFTDVACSASGSEQGTVNTLLSPVAYQRRSAIDKRLQRRQIFCSS